MVLITDHDMPGGRPSWRYKPNPELVDFYNNLPDELLADIPEPPRSYYIIPCIRCDICADECDCFVCNIEAMRSHAHRQMMNWELLMYDRFPQVRNKLLAH